MKTENLEKNLKHNKEVTEIYQKYNSPLRGFIAKRVPSKEDCEDILQNVFYQLSKTDFETNPIEQISGWLYSVARNQIIDRSRKHKEQELPYVINDNDEAVFLKEITETILDSDSPETEFLKSLVWKELEVALGELPPEQRSVFELTELEGFSFKEISEATDIGVNTLISRKRYAVLHLRKKLYELYEDLLSD
ncbi:RNA polymerase sigma factor (sigma-70 family) [Dysgonomonas sp. PH5-45]|uniref:RNA polymerase sigma factor n=1 Tax=unclassified Dysgonomonas TaxID=2630389 RepID=UPI002476D8A4|nr:MULTISPECIES: sigma-70 family RNA polymerase sigma factor [unclassified Dysgonomonas]MDH6355366.1 RNA polymerase sigma factor (sigma-70 family) [Dysgonomonas sp. PH5-45]MDH6388264.1 RNA polymerase sigma factor (sigma-70 family) [Dysgonomonas sp. PH5-37]